MSFLKGSTHSCLQKCEPPIYTVFVEAVGPLAVPLTGEHCTLCPLFTLTCICMSIPKVSECFEAGFCFELIVKNGLWEAYLVVSCRCKIKLLENVNINFVLCKEFQTWHSDLPWVLEVFSLWDSHSFAPLAPP